MDSKRIGFISTRLAGTDGVSLETFKWAEVLERMGHECYFLAGELDTPPARSMLVPSCHFNHPGVLEIQEGCFNQDHRMPRISRKCDDMKGVLKQSIRDFVDHFHLDMIIPENAVTIPMNIPLGVAITEYLLEHETACIAHHHDFYWERQRFQRNACPDYLAQAFPPRINKVQHAVINSAQVNQLSLRKGLSAAVIPNVMDFAKPPEMGNGFVENLREDLGLPPEHKLILQPTRIVQRKGIEHAIELINRLEIPATLVISHASGDEGDDYATRVLEYSEILGVNTLMCGDRIGEVRETLENGKRVYALSDVYEAADLVTYPSTIEGFGNAFLEAVFYQRPILVNNYAIYDSDIRPKGFKTVEMEDFINHDTVEQARRVLTDPVVTAEMVETNYELARRFFSYEVLEQKLATLMMNCFGH